ncbi:MAG: HIT family protein [Candidatus Magasanikbacteria bacterium CG10_big_fil_rev_8_21_14_0_10_47_10]|uniref:HIT family protein n=1 Tax=Candidatus Magasanikbacteria bacterium CG10_big_fil_rev_8_21_14_0_10_47_10 TaxID=1974652 RepID=A0A2H0TQI1_9BACT|nr:MAG: HIT family protein [Candidatus Magasanikbacteria bacterium CG10_big_fil_rev_8_21_14_0_10_47_10]
MKDCIFCRIVSKEIPNYTVFEDTHGLAFLDIHPRAKGHTVVIPKVHAETVLDFDDELLGDFFRVVKRTQERLDRVLHPDGYTVGWNHGSAGGQLVPHIHVHILPRWENDGGGNIHSIIDNPGAMIPEQIAKMFGDHAV